MLFVTLATLFAWYWFQPIPVSVDCTRLHDSGDDWASAKAPEVNLDWYVDECLKPWFDQPRSQSRMVFLSPRKVVPLFERLSKKSKQRTLRYVGLRSGQEDAFAEQLNGLQGYRFDPGKKSLLVTAPNGETVDLPSLKKHVLGAHVLFLLRDGVMLALPESEIVIYLLQLNQTNLRAYTIDGNGTFDDKSYPDFADDFADHVSPHLVERMIRVFSVGFQKGWNSRLNNEQELIIADAAGIYLAESFRLHARNDYGRIRQRLASGVILGLYFRNGGRFFESTLATSRAGPPAVRHFSLKHGQYDKILPLYDEKITAYLWERHPVMMFLWRFQAPESDFGVLRGVAEKTKKSSSYTRAYFFLLRRIFQVLENESSLIGP